MVVLVVIRFLLLAMFSCFLMGGNGLGLIGIGIFIVMVHYIVVYMVIRVVL